MAKIVMEQFEERPVLPAESILLLKVQEVSVREVQGGRTGSFEKLEFKFKILDLQAIGDGSPAEKYEALIGTPVFGSTPFRLTDSTENKLRQWVEAILGMELSVGFELDTELLEGKQVRGITSQYDRKITDPRTGLPRKGVQIDSLLPYGGTVRNQAPASDTGRLWDSNAGSFVVPATAPATAPAAAANAGASAWGDEPPF